MAVLDILIAWMQVLVPQPCYDKFFVEYDLFDIPCLKIVISKCLGFVLILGSVMVKIPQIIKMIRANSAEGISLLSVTLELIAITSTLAYNFAAGYPFSAWGEAVFLAVQTALIGFLVLCLSERKTAAAMYTATYAAALAFLLSPSVPHDVLWLLQASVIPNTIIARMIQVYENYSTGSTGQLSAITIFLLFAGSLARIFTSIQETGDIMIVIIYVVSTACNAMLALQMVYYWNTQSSVKVKTN